MKRSCEPTELKNSNRKLPPAAALMTPRPPAPRVAPQLVPPPDLPG